MSDRGSITLWTLGLTVMIMFLGGISLDLWRAFEMRESLAAMADAAAVAGASHIDEDAYREHNVLQLDAGAAERAADGHLDLQQDAPRISARTISADGAVLTVTVQGEVEFSLLRIFLGSGRVPVAATGSAEAFPSP